MIYFVFISSIKDKFILQNDSKYNFFINKLSVETKRYIYTKKQENPKQIYLLKD